MSLLEHAEKEMRLAGLYEKGSDYAGMIPEAVMSLVEAHSKHGHSGGSHWLVLQIFNKVINYKTLTPITSNPDEWFKHDHDYWQNTRQCSVFSQDGGKTWYDLDDPEKKNFPKSEVEK